MSNATHSANELRHAISTFCQCLRHESDAILQTCAAFEKLQGYVGAFEKLQGYVGAIANQPTALSAADAIE